MESKQSTRVKVPSNIWLNVGDADKVTVIENVSNIDAMFLLGSDPVNTVSGHVLASNKYPLNERKETIPPGTPLWIKSSINGKSVYIIVTE